MKKQIESKSLRNSLRTVACKCSTDEPTGRNGGSGSLKRWLLAVLLPAIFLCATANAGTIYLEDNSAGLWRSAAPAGPFTFVGLTTIGGLPRIMTDIAYSNGTLYGIDFDNLYTINPHTGVSALVGNIAGGNGLLNALTADSNGTLYAAGGSDLYTVSTTGTATLYGTGPYISSGDLAFLGGSLYLTSAYTDDLYIVGAGNSNATFIGHIGFSGIYGLANVNGSLYGYTDFGDVLSISTVDGSPTLLATGTGWYGATTTPEPGTLALFGTGVLGLGGSLRRRLLG